MTPDRPFRRRVAYRQCAVAACDIWISGVKTSQYRIQTTTISYKQPVSKYIFSTDLVVVNNVLDRIRQRRRFLVRLAAPTVYFSGVPVIA